MTVEPVRGELRFTLKKPTQILEDCDSVEIGEPDAFAR